jgi:hypothetical protein
MAAALVTGFEKYVEYLATGKLDGYLDSIRREDKVTDLEPLDQILLLHDLGKHLDQARIEQLFIHDTVFVVSVSGTHVTIVSSYLVPCSHLFGVSGSGKTRLSLVNRVGFQPTCLLGGADDGFHPYLQPHLFLNVLFRLPHLLM